MNETIAELRRLRKEYETAHAGRRHDIRIQAWRALPELLDRREQLEAENARRYAKIMERDTDCCNLQATLEQYEKELSDLRDIEATFQRLNVLNAQYEKALREIADCVDSWNSEAVETMKEIAREALAQADNTPERQIHGSVSGRITYRKKPIRVKARRVTETEYIDTLEGRMRADVGDWIITGIKGEQYPCKPDIFDATYEPVADSAPKRVPCDGGCAGTEFEPKDGWHDSAKEEKGE